MNFSEIQEFDINDIRTARLYMSAMICWVKSCVVYIAPTSIDPPPDAETYPGIFKARVDYEQVFMQFFEEFPCLYAEKHENDLRSILYNVIEAVHPELPDYLYEFNEELPEDRQQKECPVFYILNMPAEKNAIMRFNF